MTAAPDYQVFGLRIRSELALPELLAATDTGDPDVTIGLGPVPAPLGNRAGVHADGAGLVLAVPDIARYRVEGGTRITVEPTAGAPDRNVRLYLLGSALGLALHQRGLLPLHANAVEIGGRAVAFMGPSGSGKSTLAAWFHDRGYRIIADDVCVVGFDASNRPLAMPGLPRLRLWKEALEASGRRPASYNRSWDGAEDWDKFDVPLARQTVITEQTPLAAVYLLEEGDSAQIEQLRGAAAAQALIENTYRGRHVLAAGDPRLHWEACVRLAARTPLFRLQRPWGLSRVDDDMVAVLPQILEVLESAPGQGATQEVGR